MWLGIFWVTNLVVLLGGMIRLGMKDARNRAAFQRIPGDPRGTTQMLLRSRERKTDVL